MAVSSFRSSDWWPGNDYRGAKVIAPMLIIVQLGLGRHIRDIETNIQLSCGTSVVLSTVCSHWLVSGTFGRLNWHPFVHVLEFRSYCIWAFETYDSHAGEITQHSVFPLVLVPVPYCHRWQGSSPFRQAITGTVIELSSFQGFPQKRPRYNGNWLHPRAKSS